MAIPYHDGYMVHTHHEATSGRTGSAADQGRIRTGARFRCPSNQMWKVATGVDGIKSSIL